MPRVVRTTKRRITHVADTPVQNLSNYSLPKPQRTGWLEKLTPLFLLLSIVLAFFVGVLWEKVNYLEKGSTTPTTLGTTNTATNTGTAPQAKISLAQIKELFSKDLIKFGDSNKKLLFVEVADPSCPYCHVAAGHNSELNKQMGPTFTLKADGGTYIAPVTEMKSLVSSGKASLVYIYTPGHGSGEMGMKALYCAFEKGKFWQVHDLLYSNAGYNLLNNTVKNDKTKSSDLADFLKSAMNVNDLKSCLDSGKYDARITSDIQVATSLGIQGTPGFFVNDNVFNGAYGWDKNNTDPNTRTEIPNSSMASLSGAALK